MGIEMEAGKPGWYDAMNGLPGLFGSSMPETYELKRLIEFLIQAIHERGDFELALPLEVHELLEATATHARKRSCFDLIPNASTSTGSRVTSAREAYRQKIRLGFDGAERSDDSSDPWSEACKLSWQKIEGRHPAGHRNQPGFTPHLFCIPG